MNIRKANPEDIPFIVDFQLKMAWETEAIQLEKPVVTKGVEAVFLDPSKGFYLLAEPGHEVVASMLLTPEWSDWRNKTFLWIQSLYVLPQFRKKGVFKKMYRHVKELVEGSPEFAGLKLYVDRDNHPAQEVYSRIGMEESHYRLYEWNKLDF